MGIRVVMSLMAIKKDETKQKNKQASNNTVKSTKDKQLRKDTESPHTKRKIIEGNATYLASFPELDPNPILELDQEGNLKYVNPATIQFFPDITTIGVKHPFLVDWAQVVKALQDTNWSETVTREIKVGNEYYEQVISLVTKDQIRIYSRKITKRKQAEEALKATGERFRFLTENSPDMITRFIFFPVAHFEYVSPAVKVITGYTPEEYYANPNLNAVIVHPEEKGLRQSMMDKPELYEGIPVQMRYIRKDGRTIWVERRQVSTRDETGKLIALETIIRDITEMKRLEDETKQTNERLNVMVKRLEEQQRQNTILTEMRDMLQACSKMEETAPIIMGFMKKLFPTSQGALFLLSNSRSDLESIVTWGDFPTSSDNNVFPPDACWGLRRGRAHVVDDINIGPICPHLINTPSAPYVCLPLMAKGDIVGLLHLKSFNNDSGQNTKTDDLRQMAFTLSEYLSLSIANVKLSESLSKQSIQDPQSGLYNRRFMEESLQREMLRAARKQTHIGIIMGDLDHFKKFNDVYGHAAGDKIIVQIGKLFKDKFRGSDIACRYGGEEFLIILPESSPEDTVKRAEALREEIKKMEMVFQGQILGSITMSMGIASYPEKGTRMEELLRVADTALYKAKQEGRDRVISG